MNFTMLENCVALNDDHKTSAIFADSYVASNGDNVFVTPIIVADLLEAIDRLLPYAQRPASASGPRRRFLDVDDAPGRRRQKRRHGQGKGLHDESRK